MNIFYSTVFVTLLFDGITKCFAVIFLRPGFSFSIIGNFFQFTYIRNYGAAFGILPGKQYFLVFMSLAVITYILWFIHKEKPRHLYMQLGLGFLLGGTIGNLFNRIFQGYVIDFIDFNFWPTFNIADIAINLGVMLILYYTFFIEGKNKKKRGKKNKKKSKRNTIRKK